jgi:membrane associated rhomboid family serine protease
MQAESEKEGDDQVKEREYKFETNGEEAEGRDENFCQSLCVFCCPKLSITQFIAIISILEFIVFIISLCLFGLSNDAFLAPDQHALAILGCADAKSTKNDYEFYRLIMPTFLHANLEHIAGNVAFQLYLGSCIESGIGFVRMAFLYLVSEIGGVLLAITVAPENYGVGASCAGYGLVGFIFSYLFTNWFYMGRQKKYLIMRIPSQRWYLTFLFSALFLMN